MIKKSRFESNNIVDCFKSQYVEMIVPKKLNSGELNGLEWILPKLEQHNMLEVPKISYTYKNSQNQITQKLSNCR